MGVKVEYFRIKINDSEVEARRCNKCKEIKPMTEFPYAVKSKGTRKGQCKECYQKYRESVKDKMKDYYKEYSRVNKERENARRREFYAKNREEKTAKRRQYYAENKEKIAIMRKRCRDNNKNYLEKALERQRRYYKTIPEYRERDNNNSRKRYRAKKHLYLEYNRKYRKTERGRELSRRRNQLRRAKIGETIATFSYVQWNNCLQVFDNSCCYCGKNEKLEQDHFVPLKSGGEYAVKNIVPACKRCNVSKNDSNFFDWYPKQKFYSPERVSKILKYLDIKDNTQQIAMF